ncbi:MAG: DNA ligase [Syntrophomonadaceae bacterium]|nr:DNA ligase [Syntrophomonadaceae bacterium]
MAKSLITPMSPINHNEIFDDANFIYQVKWDGVRMISYIKNNEVTLINKRLNPRTDQYPELQLLSSIVKGHDLTILDGEIIALENGKPSFPTVMRRDNTTDTKKINLLTKMIPVLYMVFDILYLEGRDLRKLPWQERNQILLDTVKPYPHIHVVETFNEGTSLFQAVKKQELEGIVAKHKESPYVSGNKHRYWFKIKYRRRLSCVIGGYTLNNKTINALLVGVYDKNELRYCGKVGTGLKSSEWATLTNEIDKMKSSTCPFVDFPSSEMNKVHFVKPLLTVEIEYAEWTPDIRLRAPSIIGFINKKPEECVIK